MSKRPSQRSKHFSLTLRPSGLKGISGQGDFNGITMEINNLFGEQGSLFSEVNIWDLVRDRERIIEGKSGDIVQGHGLNLMVEICLDNDKLFSTGQERQFILTGSGHQEPSY